MMVGAEEKHSHTFCEWNMACLEHQSDRYAGQSEGHLPAEIKEISGGAVVYVYSGLCFTSPWLCEDPLRILATALVGQWSIDPQALGRRPCQRAE